MYLPGWKLLTWTHANFLNGFATSVYTYTWRPFGSFVWRQGEGVVAWVVEGGSRQKYPYDSQVYCQPWGGQDGDRLPLDPERIPVVRGNFVLGSHNRALVVNV